MYSVNDGYRQRLAQAERAIGELNALKALCYEPSVIGGGELYVKAEEVIDKTVEEIRDNFC